MTQGRGSKGRGAGAGGGPDGAPWAVLGGAVGLAVGQLFESDLGPFAGLGLGVGGALLYALWSWVLGLSARVRCLEDQIEHFERSPSTGSLEDAAESPATRAPARPEARGATPRPGTPSPRVPETSPPMRARGLAEMPSRPPRPAAAPARAPAAPDGSPLWTTVRALLFGGNTVVRVGLLVLLVGVALLARWAAEQALLPIELRLAFAALLGLGLIGVGYRLRERRPGFATSLEGGGIAALYLVTFFAYRTYELLSPGIAFALFVAFAVAGGALALLQRSQPLMIIGSLGGFVAPIAASAGGGSHVALFGYYLLLDVAIAWVAWLRPWRAVLGVAFAFTYGVATLFGVLEYEPRAFASTEPFVIAFLLLFSSLPIAFALRGARAGGGDTGLGGSVEGTLVFGTPLFTLMLQAGLVEGRSFGLAVSAAGLGVYYAAIACALRRSLGVALREQIRAYTALAVGLGTIAIPFALDEGMTTAIAWSLEGAGLYWIGVQQRRRGARYAGVALQLLAGLAFTVGRWPDAPEVPLANARLLSCVALALASFFIARTAWVRRSDMPEHEGHRVQGLAVWALGWWALGAWAEIDAFVPRDAETAVWLVWIGASALALEAIGSREDWLAGRVLALAALPASALGLVRALSVEPHLLAHGGALAWPFLLGSMAFVQQRLARTSLQWVGRTWAPLIWLTAAVVSLAAQGAVELGLPGVGLELGADFARAALGLGLAGVLVAVADAVRRGRSWVGQSAPVWLGEGAGIVAVALSIWLVNVQLVADGSSEPLAYLPLASPIDFAIAASLAALWIWWRTARQHVAEIAGPGARPLAGWLAAAVGFEWLNGMLVRSAHQWTGVPLRVGALWDSVALQAAASITWTLVALAVMVYAHRSATRGAWLGAAGLLGVVVLKLFTIDLAQLSALAKIGTFLVVGLLLLIVGYVSPVPPARGLDPEPDGAPTS